MTESNIYLHTHAHRYLVQLLVKAVFIRLDESDLPTTYWV